MQIEVPISGLDSLTWGTCSYIKENETVPTIAMFCIWTDSSKLTRYSISENVKNNTVYFEHKRIITIDKGKTVGRELDNLANYTFNLELKIDPTQQKLADTVEITWLYNNTGEQRIELIYPDNNTQNGLLPDKYFTFEEMEKYDTDELAKDTLQETATLEDNNADKVTEITENTEKDSENTESTEKPDSTIEDTKENQINSTNANTAIQIFTDVPKNHWAFNEIQTFSENKIVLGYGNGLFGVNDSITYEHFALLLDRLFEYKAENTTSVPAIREDIIVSVVKALKLDTSNVSENIIEKFFTDCQNIKKENKKYIATAIEKGLVIGSDGKLFPDDMLTRAETVMLLSRAMK